MAEQLTGLLFDSGNGSGSRRIVAAGFVADLFVRPTAGSRREKKIERSSVDDAENNNIVVEIHQLAST